MAKLTNVVAVIDDDVGILVSIKEMLLSAGGYDVELYASTEAFLAAVSTTAASCLIVDVHIGDSDGIDLVSQLKAAGFNFRTIFITASDYATVQNRIEKLGCVGFLRKPFSADLLIAALVNA